MGHQAVPAMCSRPLPAQPTKAPRSVGRAASLRRPAMLLLAAVTAAGLGGCSTIGNYLNLRNSFLDPSQVGRFDKANPFGRVEPVKWPILDSLDISDPPSGPWADSRPPDKRDLVPQVKAYVLGPGDVVQVSVFDLVVPGQESVQTRRINSLGYVDLDFIGQVLCSGLTPTQLQQKIIQILINSGQMKAPAIGRPGPQVSVEVVQSRTRVFSIIGAATRPGTYNILTPDFRLLDALALAGDMQYEPGMHWLYIIRQEPYLVKGHHRKQRKLSHAVRFGTSKKPAPFSVLEHIGNEGGRHRHKRRKQHAKMHSLHRDDHHGKRSSNASFLTPHLHTVALADALDSGDLARNNANHGKFDVGPTGAGARVHRSHMAAPSSKKTRSLLQQAISPSAHHHSVRWVFIDGRWVPIEMQPQRTQLPHSGPPKPVKVPSTREYSKVLPPNRLVQQRVIRIPIRALREGVSKDNIVIRPGDIINIPPVRPGEFYMMGNVTRPGAYNLTGHKITLKMAVAAAGNLGPLAIPRRCEITRRVAHNQEVIVEVNLQRIFDGTEPDIYLKPNDVVNVGTDALANFLAVTRNAYRMSYGFGFVYDRNFYLYPPGVIP